MMRNIFVYIIIFCTLSRFCYTTTVTYYVYMEACFDRFCYAIKGINVSYNTESKDISLLCTAALPLDDEETLPKAEAKGSNGWPVQPCNDTTALLLKYVTDSQSDSSASVLISYHDFPDTPQSRGRWKTEPGEMTVANIVINIQRNGSISVEDKHLINNEPMWQCNIYEHAYKRACFCKENHARDYCLHRAYQKFDPLRPDKEYYHIYGALTTNDLHYYYYFEIHSDKNRDIYVQLTSASVLRETGGGESISLCVSYNGSASEVERISEMECYGTQMDIAKEKHSNFTAFGKLEVNDKWQSLMWFDYLTWSKSYIPGNCSFEKQVIDGTMHQFAICMRRNVTEKFYKKITQDIQSDSTSMDNGYNETDTSTLSSLIDDEDIDEALAQIAETTNISGEVLNKVLSTLDTFLNSTQNAPQYNSSRMLRSLNTIVKNSCCDINFTGDWSLVVRRHTVSCLKTGVSKEWPTMKEIPKRSNFGYYESKNDNHVSIEIPYETVCNEGKNHEYILIYYLFSNQALFDEKRAKEKAEYENVCELRKRAEQNAPVLSAQLVEKSAMETIHQMDIDREYKQMAKIVFPELRTIKLHGATKLVYWEGEKWVDTNNSQTHLENDQYMYITYHLTDFTLVVDGLEMDPMLCDVALDSVSVCINFLSFVGLLMLIGYLSITRYLPDDRPQKNCSRARKLQKLPSKYEKTRLNYFVSLALFHLGFLLFSDSRDLFWPISCDIAALALYWLLLTCILITTFQSLHILKILVCNSLVENLLILVIGRKFVLFATLGIPTTVGLALKITLPHFFDRQDYFCWIRPDYIVPAVILPLGFLGINSVFIFCVIFLRMASQGNIFGIYVRFGQSSVRTIISASTSSTRSDASSSSTASNGAKYVEKAFTLLCIQLMLGIPWICQYLVLFAPQLTAAHYIFTLVIGSQGLIFFVLFCYRKIRRYSK
ncbi:MeTHuselah like protein [Ditylenchus destructor]|uniref:MeTHuselah like protein n=1 Tax=Ditylenchus destructor TaxID=166010 RepID=A0AAD4N440_9BILA|nr:MeTHuselah like protein [Ditylenchus destructor]